MMTSMTMMTMIMHTQQQKSQQFQNNLHYRIIHPPAFVVPLPRSRGRTRCRPFPRGGGDSSRQRQQHQHQHHYQSYSSSPSSSSPSSSSSSPPFLFGGHIVARILPPDVPNDYDQHTKPLANRIPINELFAQHQQQQHKLENTSTKNSSSGGSGDKNNSHHYGAPDPPTTATATTTTDNDDDQYDKNANSCFDNHSNAIIVGRGQRIGGKHHNHTTTAAATTDATTNDNISNNEYLSNLLSEYNSTTAERTTATEQEQERSLRVDAYLFPLLYDDDDDDDNDHDREYEEREEEDVVVGSTLNNDDGMDVDNMAVVDEDSIISVSLMRKESELATQALKRLELSILKKLKSNNVNVNVNVNDALKHNNNNNNKKRNSNDGSTSVINGNGNISSTSNSNDSGNIDSSNKKNGSSSNITTKKTKHGKTTTKTITAIYIDGQRVDNWPNQLSNLVNGDFWRIASEHSMEICIDLMGKGTESRSSVVHALKEDHGDDGGRYPKGGSNTSEGQYTITMPVECNPPTIVGVFAFEKFNGKIFPGIPVVVQVKSLYATHVVVDWYLDGKIVRNDSLCYIPTSKDANKRLSVVLTPQRPDHDGRGYQEAYFFSELVLEDRPRNELLSIRPEWIKEITPTKICAEDKVKEKTTVKSEGGDSGLTKPLRILSYNILADQNAYSMENPGMPYFPWTTVDLMDRKRRMPLILHEILSYGADIICLQEVDEYIYETILHPALEYYNYQGFFSMKMATGTREGCATFFSLMKFQRSHDQELHTIRISDIINDMSTSTNIAPGWHESVKPVVELFRSCPDLHETVDNLAHVVQVARLKDLNGSPIIVANTHLFFHPLADHIRVLQCFAIAHQLSVESKNGDMPFIVCGDFNTDIDDCAAILLDRIVPENGGGHGDVQRCLNTFRWKEEQHRAENKSNVSFPELKLPESFPVIISGYTEHPDFTHYVKEYKATLDHILMSPSTKVARLQPIRQAPLPSSEQVEQQIAMPSVSFPSDHCSIVVDATWTKKTHP